MGSVWDGGKEKMALKVEHDLSQSRTVATALPTSLPTLLTTNMMHQPLNLNIS